MSPQNKNTALINKRAARHSFNNAAGTYDAVAALQREVGQRLLDRMELVRLEPKVIADIGCGTGDMTFKIIKTYKNAHVIGIDFAELMLTKARSKLSWRDKLSSRQPRFVCGDAESLPITNHSVDFIFSNLTLQWCNNLDATFTEFRRVLKPGGLLMFSTLGPDTLKELRQSWNSTDAEQHVHTFIDMHHVGDALLRARFSDPVMDMEYFTLTYSDGYQLMRELKQLGAHNASSDRPHNLTGKSHLRQMLQMYEQFRTDGKLPATYEVVYGHAWCLETKNDTAKNINRNTISVDFGK